MPKDNRKIAGSIRIKGQVITDADELAAAATPAELARLTERGVISGFVTEKAEAPKAPAKEEKK